MKTAQQIRNEIIETTHIDLIDRIERQIELDMYSRLTVVCVNHNEINVGDIIEYLNDLGYTCEFNAHNVRESQIHITW